LCETPPRRAAEPAPEQAPAAISEFVEEPVPAPTPNPAPAKTWPCGYCGNEYGRELQAIKCAARCSVDRVAILGEINAKADAKEMPAAPETPKAPEPVLAAPTACATCRAYGSTWVPSQQAPCTIHSGPAPAEWVAAHRDRERTRLRERGVPPKLWPSELQAAA
jgi:hypothetical protein